MQDHLIHCFDVLVIERAGDPSASKRVRSSEPGNGTHHHLEEQDPKDLPVDCHCLSLAVEEFRSDVFGCAVEGWA